MICNHGVAGSSPAAGTNRFKNKAQFIDWALSFPMPATALCSMGNSWVLRLSQESKFHKKTTTFRSWFLCGTVSQPHQAAQVRAQPCLRRRARPSPSRPRPKSAMVAGSGTGLGKPPKITSSEPLMVWVPAGVKLLSCPDWNEML